MTLYYDKVDKMTRVALSVSGSKPRMYRQLISEYRDMQSGGTGGPHLYGHRWTTVRKAYFRNWLDSDFTELLSRLGELDAV